MGTHTTAGQRIHITHPTDHATHIPVMTLFNLADLGKFVANLQPALSPASPRAVDGLSDHSAKLGARLGQLTLVAHNSRSLCLCVCVCVCVCRSLSSLLPCLSFHDSTRSREDARETCAV